MTVEKTAIVITPTNQTGRQCHERIRIPSPWAVTRSNRGKNGAFQVRLVLIYFTLVKKLAN